MALAKGCYVLTKAFPKEELYGMTSQIRRASSSIPANIAEGSGRGTKKDFVSFLRIAQGSLRELETHLLLSIDVDLTNVDTVTPLLSEISSVGYLLQRLIASQIG